MNVHEFGHVECGGAGKLLGEKRIYIKDHEVLNIAVHLKHEELVEYYGATEKQAEAIGKMISADIVKWKKKLKEKFGVKYYSYEPDQRNA
jgi:hypothetical protein